MRNLRTVKRFKKLFGSMAIALSLCVISISPLKVNATEITDNETVDGGTVDITIDNSASHLGVRFYPDTNDMDIFKYVEVGATETYTVSKDSVARIRLYVQADGYYVPDGYIVEGATKLANDDRVNFGWCRAAYTITADATKTITIPEASVCTHPYADPSVRWGYYNRGDGTHAQACTLCASDIPGTIANHSFAEMTATEYADWYYDDGNFAGIPAEQIASRKADMIAMITAELGVDAETKIKACTLCEHWVKIENTSTETPSEKPASTESTSSAEKAEKPASTESTSSVKTPTVSQTPTVTAISTTLKDASGILSEGTIIATTSVTSGDVYEKASAVVKEKISGLGQFAVMEINLTDASNVQIHELNGYVQVSIPVPSNISVGSGKTIAVYRLEDDGTLTRCQTTVENGIITFSTNHFSTYIVVEEDAAASPKTGDDFFMNCVIYMIMITVMAGIGLMVITKRKRI